MVTFSMVHHEIERQLDHRIELETQSLLATYERAGFDVLVGAVKDRDRRPARGTLGYLAGRSEVGSRMGYMVFDASGKRRAGDFQAETPPPGWSEFVRFRRPDGGKGVAQAMNVALSGGGRLVVAADRADLIDIDRALLRVFLISAGLVAAVGVLATFAFGGVVQRRLNAIQGAAEGIMAGDMRRRMPVDGSGGEFDQLAVVLNRMLDRIEDLMSNLRQVSGDIAHDIRTPLTRLRARLEAIEEGIEDGEGRSRVEGALTEVDDLHELLSGLLALAEIEGRSVRDRFGKVDLAGLVRELADAYGPALERAGMSLELELGGATLRGDRPLLLQALSNLMDNSLFHAGPGSRITISARPTEGGARLLFADDGRGVPAEDRHRIFKRFVRLDPSRTTPGHGLGLAMVAAIVSAHGGDIAVKPSDRGLAFEIMLPTDG
ncbi:MAG: ATP-binding protein [Caulobacter sp.]